MEFQQIISDIFSGLTGDAKADMKYLHEQLFLTHADIQILRKRFLV